MSWLFGRIGYIKTGMELRERCPQPPLVTIELADTCIYAGGNSRTLLSGMLASGEQYIVLGYPVLINGDSYENISQRNLPGLLQTEGFHERLDGHYLILIVGKNGIRAYNDPLGKRTLYIHQLDGEIFFTSSLSLLKSVIQPELDFRKLGAYWHTMFPPSNDRYAPTDQSYFKDITMLGTGSCAVLGKEFSLRNKLFVPSTQKKDIYSLLKSFCLVPTGDSSRVAIALSGGMDIRPLLAVYLNAGQKISAIHYGNKDTQDHQIGKEIAEKFGIPYRHISYEEAEGSDPWAQAVDFMGSRGVTANPVNAPYLGYYGKVAEEFDTFVSGYFGELYRFRFFVAHLLSLFKSKKLTVADLNAYLYRIPAKVFIPEVATQLHQGYAHQIREVFAKMPSPKEMLNPFWFNLLLARYSPLTVNMPSLSDLDCALLDHMPWLQSEIISQHWHQSFPFQMAEGVHRTLLRRNYPALEQFPLAALDVKAPYPYRQYMVKVKMWQHYRKHPLTRISRSDRFLEINQAQILDLFHSQRVKDYIPYDRISLSDSITAYYRGDKTRRDTLLSWLAIELGR